MAVEMAERAAEAAPLLFNLEDGARFLGVRTWTLRRLIQDGEIATITYGRMTFVPRWALEEFANRGRGDAPES